MKAVNNYLKNVMKSVAYAAADVGSEHMPTMGEFASSNKDFATATYAALRNPSMFIRKQTQAIQESKIYKALDYGARNLSEDLRTGNFYNKERKDRDELALSGLDTNWDDLSEFGVDSDWEKKMDSSTSKSSEVSAGDMKIVESIEGSNAALASATVNAVVASSQNEIKNGRMNTAILFTQNERLFGGLHKDMTVLGSTMQQMYKLQSASLQNIDKNMSNFFTQEAKLSAERNAMLKEMLEMQRNMYKSASDKEKEAAGKKKSNRIRWGDINVNGAVNLSSYFDAVKKNISNELSAIMPGGFGEDSNMLATFMTSPLEGVMKYVINGVIPATVKAASKEFDGTISGVFGNIIGELGNARSKNEGGLLGTIAKFLGVSTSVNRSIDTSKYEKGPIPFDGITRKAIIDVIPTHLRRIEAAITGRPEEMFDYKAGRWVEVSNVKKQYEDIKRNAVKRATSDLREAMNPGIQAVRKGIGNKYDRDEWDKAVEEFEQFLYDNNGRFNPKVSASKNGISAATYPSLYRNYSKIRTIFSDFDRIESTDRNGRPVTRNTRNSVRMRLSNSVLDAKDAEEKQYRSIESDVGSALHTFFGIPKADAHGKYKSNGKFEAYNALKNTTDELGNTVFTYLQNINKELTWFRLNGVPGGGGGTSKFTGSGIKIDAIDLKNPSMAVSSNTYDKRASEDERIAKSALEAIQSGKAVDLRDFDKDEQAYLLGLSMLLSDNAVGEFQSEIKGYNSSAIASFMDKHFHKTNIKTLKDVDEAIKKAEKEGKNTNEVNMDPKEEKFFKKILNKIGAGETVLGGIVGASSEAFTNLLYTADKAIYEMMYKTEISDEAKQKYNGFMDMMAGKMTDTFQRVSDWFKEDILEPFKKRFGLDGKFKEDFTESLKKTGSKLWTSFRDANASVYGPLFNRIFPGKEIDYEELERQELEAQKQQRKEEMDYRRAVKSGIRGKDTATSKITKKNFARAFKSGTKEWSFYGDKSEEANEARRVRSLLIKNGTPEELEIWAEENGFTGSLDEKKVRLGSEFGLPSAALARIKTDYDANLVFAKQFRHHAKGTPSGRPFSGLTTLTKGEGLITSKGFSTVPKTGVYNVTNTHIINRRDMASLSGRTLSNASIQNDLGKEKLAARRSGYRISSNAKGTMKITNDGVDINSKEFLEEAKKYIPEAASGGLIGGILSMVLGIAGGPLLGAAVGAGGSILASSGGLREKLFGKAGEDGKNDGSGFISKSVMDTFNKYFPDMAKYGLAGLIPGLLTPLGPIGGLLVGGAFGFLKNNENFTNKYFGEEGKLTLKSDDKKILEKLMPGAGKGAIAGALTTLLLPTPFGLLGNAALGAGLGMMASTDEFKNLILGEEINGERMGGIVGAFKDAFAPFTDSLKTAGEKLKEAFEENVIDPLTKFIKPAIHALPIALGAPFKKLSQMLEKAGKGIGKTIGTRIKKSRVGKWAGKVVSGAASGVKWVTSLPGRAIGGIGDKLREYDIAHGDMVDMDQDEAVAWMDARNRGDKVSSFLRTSASIGKEDDDKAITVDSATRIRDLLNRMNDTQSSAKKNLKKKNDELNNFLTSYTTASGKKLSRKQISRILSAANKGNLESVASILQDNALEDSSDGMTKAEFNDIMDGKDGKSGLRKVLTEAVGAKTRLENIDKIGDTEAADGIRELLKGTHLSEKDIEKLLTDKSARSDFSRLLSDNLLHLEANPEEVKLETENNEIFKKLDINIENILKLLTAKLTGTDEDVKKAADKAAADLEKGVSTSTKIYDKRTGDAMYAMGTDAGNLTEEGRDLLSTGNHTKDALKFGAAGINNATGGFANLHKAFKGNKNITKELYALTTDEAKKAISNLSKGKAKNLAKALNQKVIRNTIINGKYEINPEAVQYLSNGRNFEPLKENCIFLAQIYNSKNGKGIYSEYKSIQEIGAISLKSRYDLSTKYGIKFSSKTGVAGIDIMRTTRSGGRKLYLAGKKITGATIKGAGKVGKFTLETGAKGAVAASRSISDAISYKKVHSDGKISEKDLPADNAYGTIASHGAGSVILSLLPSILDIGGKVIGGAAKIVGGIGKAGFNAVKGLGGIAKGLLSGDVEAAGKAGAAGLGGMMSGLTSAGQGASGIVGGVANNDETDKPGDGKDLVHVGNGDMIQVERDSSGNVEPDTGDSRTKTILSKLSLKEKMAEKLQAAQLKASELIKTNFDTSQVKGSKGGKIGWLGLLLGFGALGGLGLIRKLFDGFIKPIWTEHIKPWITDTAIPWISDKWNNKIKPWITDKALPALTNGLGKVLGLLIQNLPDILVSALKTAFNIGSTVADAITGNKTNAGSSNIVNANNLVESYGSDYTTQMYDENGNVLTAGDIANGNYTKIYNSQGVEGTVNENGDITFYDTSLKGSSYIKTMSKAAGYSFAKSLASGKAGKLVGGASKVAGWFTKRKNLLAKSVGVAGKTVTAPTELGSKAGVAAKGILDKAVDSAADRVIDKAIKSGASDEALEVVLNNVVHGDGKGLINKVRSGIKTAKEASKSRLGSVKSKIKNLFKSGTEETVEETAAKMVKEGAEKMAMESVEAVTKEGTEAAVKSTAAQVTKKVAEAAGDAAVAGTKKKGLLAKLVGWLKTGIKKLFSNEKVVKMFTKLAETLGKTAPAKWIKGIKESIEKIFNEALEKAVQKVGADAVKNVASKALFWVFLITDFLTGCDQAESILGVSETTIVEEIIAGLINALCNLLIIPSIFPGVPWIAKALFKLFGQDLEERQKQADAEYQQYLEETGSTLTKEEYLKREKSVTGKIGGWFSDQWNKITGKNKKSDSKKSNDDESTTAVEANASGTTALTSILSVGAMGPLGLALPLIGNMTGAFKFDNLNNTIDKAKDGKVSVFSKDYWKSDNTNDNDNSFKGTLQKSYSMLSKIINAPVLIIKESLEQMSTDIEDVGAAMSGDISTTSSSVTSTKSKTKTGSKIKSIFSKIVSGIKNFFGGGTGSYMYGTGNYSKQIDPSISGMRFNASGDSEYQTIGNSGCGPAAAVNALEYMYGRGNAVASAAKYALRRGYKETNGGTKPGFFTDYFNSNGLSSQTSYNKSVIARNINNGLPTVIMGSNPKGTSSSSPFGRNPHYVTVTGTDGKGNAIVQDPESKYDNQLYPLSSLMNNTTLGVSAFGRGKWGRGDYDAQIWWYLKQMGMTDEGAAGLMGNLYAESGLNPNNVENAVNTYTGMTDEEYTAAVDNGTIDRLTFLHPKGGDSKYGYGLAQWTYINKNNEGRKANFYDYMKTQRKVSIGDLGAQLDFLNNELTNSYGSVLSTLKSTDSLATASDTVLMDFENPKNASSKKSERQGYGQTYLDKYKGTEGEQLSTSSDSSDGNIFSEITGLFGDLLGNSDIGKLLSEFTSGISTISSALLGGSSDGVSYGSGDIAKIVRIARGEIGTKEKSVNNVKYNDWYYNYNVSGDKYPWCAAFTSWVANQAGIPTDIIPKTASTKSSYNTLVSRGGEVSRSSAIPGDYIFFSKSGDPSGISHTGIVTGNDGSRISTVEGNTSDMVAERAYSVDDTGVLVARPNYANKGTFTHYNNQANLSTIGSYNTRGSNGVKPLSRYGQFKDSMYGNGTMTFRTEYGNIKVEDTSMIDKREARISSPKAGMGTSVDYSKLINTIITVLMTIADNTDKLNTIVSILNNKLNLNISASDVSNATTDSQSLRSKLLSALNGANTSKLNTYADSIGDSSVNYIISAMNAIASE